MENWLLYSFLALLMWGAWAFFPRLAVRYLDPKSVLMFGVLGVLLVAAVLLLFGFKPEIHAQGIFFSMLSGIAGILGTLFFIYALSLGKSSLVITLSALYPIVALFLAFIILKEPITMIQGAGILLALVSMVLLSWR